LSCRIDAARAREAGISSDDDTTSHDAADDESDGITLLHSPTAFLTSFRGGVSRPAAVEAKMMEMETPARRLSTSCGARVPVQFARSSQAKKNVRVGGIDQQSVLGWNACRELLPVLQGAAEMKIAGVIGLGSTDEACRQPEVRRTARSHILKVYNRYFFSIGNAGSFSLDNLLPQRDFISWSQQLLDRKLLRPLEDVCNTTLILTRYTYSTIVIWTYRVLSCKYRIRDWQHQPG
jgi:hypothetical protein